MYYSLLYYLNSALYTVLQSYVLSKQGSVHMYYSLTNFYQNHRRYVKSRDDNQLLGSATDYRSLTSDCEPFRGISNSTLEGGGVAYAPCGAIANSLFNGH